MINISANSVYQFIRTSEFATFRTLDARTHRRFAFYVSAGLLVIMIAAMFLPWTQNIQGKGYVTTLRPDQKPQAIQSVISGRLERWYVREGDFVHKGDTILHITEVKAEYFDPELVQRTEEQLTATSEAADTYGGKALSLEEQYDALLQARDLKLAQTKNKIRQTLNKITGDSIDLVANLTQQGIADAQLIRAEELYAKGLRSLTELEAARLKAQEARAKVVVQENKLLVTRNELLNLRLELPAVENDYADKLAKSRSEILTARSDGLKATASSSKLRNELRNYQERQQYYFVTAPQDGYVTKAIQSGIGEIIKEGSDIVTIMPAAYDLAVEIYVRPNDLALLRINDRVRIQFDGWPALVLRGWPDMSTGTFPGEIFAIDQFISENGMYRVLIREEQVGKQWPHFLRVGAGVRAFILLKDVPIWYEVWRQLNGFPPDFYRSVEEQQQDLIKQKAPIRSVK